MGCGIPVPERNRMKTMSVNISLNLLLSVVCQVHSVCVDRPFVEHSLINASQSGPYPVETIVEVVCNKGYAPVGNAYFTCNGTHFIGNLTCNIRTCPRIDTPNNCRIVNEPSYEAGSVIIYDSYPGYIKVGQGTLLCRDDNRWSPEDPPVCKPKDCGDYTITNGQTREVEVLNGVRNAYGSVLRIDCDDGYVLNGQKYVRCQEDGTWDSRSTCEPVKCPPFPGLYSFCVNTASLFLNYYYMNCRNDISVTNGGEDNIPVHCQDNGEWSSEFLGCYCDCKVETDMTHMTVSNLNTKGYVPHGQTLNWSCKDGYVKNTTDVIKCNDGNMATPSCQLNVDEPVDKNNVADEPVYKNNVADEPVYKNNVADEPVDKTNVAWILIPAIPIILLLIGFVFRLTWQFIKIKRSQTEEATVSVVGSTDKSRSSQTNTTKQSEVEETTQLTDATPELTNSSPKKQENDARNNSTNKQNLFPNDQTTRRGGNCAADNCYIRINDL